ncbi:MAG TPA: hypothetical protein VE422_21390 [Terriglobia bacterium]|nr:hypothetical protein [Terriglobia bacterium]
MSEKQKRLFFLAIFVLVLYLVGASFGRSASLYIWMMSRIIERPELAGSPSLVPER